MATINHPSVKHLLPLTSLRFFAAAAIVIFHIQGTFAWKQISVLAQGVSFFFVLSGFILTYVYGKNFDIRLFYVSRFARLWPVHVVCFLIVSLIIRPFELLFLPINQISAVLNLGMVHSWLPVKDIPFSYNGPSWSISVEFAFYLFFPFLVKSRNFKYYYMAIFFLCLLVVFIVELIDFPLFKETFFHIIPSHVILQHPFVRVLEFATGVAFAKMFYTKPDFIKINGTFLELISVVFLMFYWITIDLIVKLFFEKSPWFSLWYSQCGGCLCFALLISVFSWENGAVSKFISNKFLVLLGEISFSTYMVHHIVIRFFVKYKIDLDWYLQLFLILFASYFGSYLLWRFVEIPSKRVIVKNFSYR